MFLKIIQTLNQFYYLLKLFLQVNFFLHLVLNFQNEDLIPFLYLLLFYLLDLQTLYQIPIYRKINPLNIYLKNIFFKFNKIKGC